MGNKLRKYKKCVSCMIVINKSAGRNPYLCRNCERDLMGDGFENSLIYNQFYG